MIKYIQKYTVKKPTKYLYQLSENEEGIFYTHPPMPFIDIFNMLQRDLVNQKVKVFYELSDDYYEICTSGKCNQQSHGYSFTTKEGMDLELGYHFCDIHGLEHMAIMNSNIRNIQKIIFKNGEK